MEGHSSPFHLGKGLSYFLSPAREVHLLTSLACREVLVFPPTPPGVKIKVYG